MHCNYYPGRAGGGAQGYRNRQSCVFHALDLCRAARNHGSTDDGRGRHAGRRAADWPIRRRWPVAADGARPCKAAFRRTRARGILRRRVAAILLFLVTCGASVAAEPFPFSQELLLDAAPMRPGKRMPILTVEASGEARIDLWCRTNTARGEIADMGMKTEGAALSR